MERLSNILPQIWAAPAWKKGLKAARLLDRWEELVGEAVAKAARPVGYARGTLTLEVSDHIWLQRLRFEEKRILSLLNQAAGEELFTRIRLTLSRSFSPTGRKRRENKARLERLAQRFKRELSVIEDEELREAFLRLRLTLARKRLG